MSRVLQPFVVSRAMSGALLMLGMTCAQAGWNAHGPYGGLARAVAGSGDHLMLGTSDGIYATDDGGASWLRLGDLPRGTQINSLAISPADPMAILAGSWSSGYRSSDGGAHWTPSNLAFNSVVIHPQAAETVAALASVSFIGADTPVLCSSDGGQTFETTVVPATAIVADAFTAGSFFAIDAEGNLYRSSGGCLAWKVAGAIMAAPEQLLQDTLDPNVLYLAYSAALDSGTFTRWDISTNTVTELIGSKSPGRVFADSVQLGRYWFDVFSSPPNYNGYGMFESTDGGMTWPYVNDLPGGLIGSDPLLADVLYGNDAVGFAVSLDAGRTWASRTSGIPLISAQVVSQDPIHPLRLAASGGAGVALSDDGGLTWTWATTPPDEPVLTFGRVPGDASRLLAGTRNALYRSDDAGHTWQHLTQPYDHFNDIAVDRGDPQKLVAVRGFAVAWSSDGGATWTPATVVGGATDFRRIVRGQIGTNRVYVLRFVHNDVNQLFRADAHGDSLVPTEGNLEVSDAAVDPSDDAVLFAVAHDETYRDWTGYLSTDAGAHWQTRGTIAQVQNGSEARVRFDPCEPRTVYLLLGSRGMYVSRDRGLTWSLEAPDVPFGYTWDFDVACSSGELVASVATNGAGVEVRDPEFIDGVFGGGFDGE